VCFHQCLESHFFLSYRHVSTTHLHRAACGCITSVFLCHASAHHVQDRSAVSNPNPIAFANHSAHRFPIARYHSNARGEFIRFVIAYPNDAADRRLISLRRWCAFHDW
jgi:hypothetical protein